MEANDLLMGGGLAAAKFPTVGTTITGRIVRKPEARQQTDIETGEPLTFANGDPRMQIVVNLATAERDPDKPEDDGERALYIKGNMLNAIRDAVRKTGAAGLEVGGTLTVTYTGDGEKKNRAFNAPKLYTATYVPPAAAAANEMLMGTPAQNPLAGTPYAGVPATVTAIQQPQWPTVATPGVPAVTPPAAPPGVDPAMWARMAPDQQVAVLAAMGQVAPF